MALEPWLEGVQQAVTEALAVNDVGVVDVRIPDAFAVPMCEALAADAEKSMGMVKAVLDEIGSHHPHTTHLNIVVPTVGPPRGRLTMGFVLTHRN